MRRLSNDRGGAAVMILPVVAGLVAATLLVVTWLGGATDARRTSTTAADAAALAGAQEWRDAMERGYTTTFLAFPGSPVQAFTAQVETRARTLAEANDARLVSVATDPDSLEVRVTVEGVRRIGPTDETFRSDATARIAITSGACRDGTVLGLWAGLCVTSPELAVEMGLTPATVGPFRAEVRLVD